MPDWLIPDSPKGGEMFGGKHISALEMYMCSQWTRGHSGFVLTKMYAQNDFHILF